MKRAAEPRTYLVAIALGLTAALVSGLLRSGQVWPAAWAEDEGQDERIARLVRELGDRDPAVRQAAQEGLEAIGAPAVPALKRALSSPDLEVRLTAEELLARIQAPRQPERPEKKAPLEQLERTVRSVFDEPEPEEELEERRGGKLRPPIDWKLDRLRRGARGDFKRYGFETGPTSAVLRAQLSIPNHEGLVVRRVAEGGWAAKHGLQQWDVLVEIDDRPLKSPRDLSRLKKPCRIELFRKAERIELELPALPQRPVESPEPDTPDTKDPDGKRERKD